MTYYPEVEFFFISIFMKDKAIDLVPYQGSGAVPLKLL
jgi:hypothetical protein